jgi:hypothetical protein
MRSHAYLVMIRYGKLFGWAFCQVHFMCFLGPLLASHQAHFWQIIKSTLANCQVHIAKWVHQLQIGKSTSPAHFLNFRAAKGLNIFLSAKKSAPKTQTAHDFFPAHRPPPWALPSLPFSSLSFYLFII